MKAALTKLAVVAVMAARGLAGAVPEFPYDPNTASNCNWWQDNIGTEDTDCWMIPAIWEITPEDFIKWNPSISYDTCTPYNLNQSYCVGVCDGPCTTSSTTTSTTSTSTSTTTTKTRAPIITPTPTQAGMVANCVAFHRVSEGDTCAVVASNNDISLPTLVKYNGGDPAMCDPVKVGNTWCVDIYHDPVVVTTTTTAASSTTESAAGATPTPVQAGMVAGCTKFYLVQEGDNCLTIARANGISASSLTKWNPVADDNDTCTGLLPGYYACVAA